ncbi:hypothetical protein, partial [Acinetobacter baumannii]|uniref:hypothetical protein n=1 Tax=Acinetobacter baumannii TaxID=470 RepID=UPI001C083B8C
DNRNRLQQEKLILVVMGFSQKEYFTIQFNGCVFALQKLSVTWQSRGIFFCIPFLAIVVQSVTTDSDAF